jgi:hypothetical protein
MTITVLLVAFLVISGLSHASNAFQSSTTTTSTQSLQFTMIGADQVAEGESSSTYSYSSFLSYLVSQGLTWDRQLVYDTSSTPWNTNAANSAGLHIIGVLGPSPSGYSETRYKSLITSTVSSYPYIHNWEYGNEPSIYWNNISPQEYFLGLVWAAEAIHAMTGHGTDKIQGPTQTIYTSNYVWNGYDGCGTVSCVDNWNGLQGDEIGWFYTFWHQSYSDALGTHTPSNTLTFVSLHVYTHGDLFSTVAPSGPYAGSTVGTMLTAALHLYFSVTGDSKKFVISETGITSNNGDSLQETWYKEMIPFYQNNPFVTGVFAYKLYDGTTDTKLFGLFDSSLHAKPAWSVYHSYFSL